MCIDLQMLCPYSYMMFIVFCSLFSVKVFLYEDKNLLILQYIPWPWKTIGHLIYTMLSFMYHLKAISEFKLELPSGNAQFWSKLVIFFPCDRWPWKTIGHIFYIASSFVHHFIAITELKLQSQPGNTQFRRPFESCDLEIWRMTLKNNRAPLLSNIKLCASFHSHQWIETAVTARKHPISTTFWVMWPWNLTDDLEKQ